MPGQSNNSNNNINNKNTKAQLIYGWVVDTRRVEQWLDDNNLQVDTGQVYINDAARGCWTRSHLLPRGVYLICTCTGANNYIYSVSLVNRAHRVRLTRLVKSPSGNVAAQFAQAFSATPIGEPLLFAMCETQ
jgi:hypothetical protein